MGDYIKRNKGEAAHIDLPPQPSGKEVILGH